MDFMIVAFVVAVISAEALVTWSGVVAVVLPLVISFVKQERWPTWANKLIAVVVSAVAAFITVGATQGWNIGSWGDFWQLFIGSFAAIFAGAQAVYARFWADSYVETKLSGIGS